MSASTSAQAAHASPYTPPAAGTAAGGVRRLQSVDLLRGVIMVLMAIDHVRVYAGIPAGGPTAGVFFTRWVTHFCAPGFVFFAGTAAFLHGRKLGDTGALSRYLATRGLMLVALELTVIRFGWTFGVDYSGFLLAGVIWMLGWCMVLLAALVRLRPAAVGWLGVGIVFLQWIFALPPRLVPESARPAFGRVWEFVYPAGLDAAGGMAVLYVLVPWIGVMAAGYGFGAIMTMDADRRSQMLRRLGVTMTGAFILAATALALTQGGNGEGGGEERPLLFRILDQQKYPASQLFLLMTLGPMIVLMPAAERARGWVADGMVTIGRVPLFYYLLHIPLIHVSALLVNMARTGEAHGEWYVYAPFAQVPAEGRWSLGLLYLVFAVNVALLYVACRWYAGVKARRPESWLRYI